MLKLLIKDKFLKNIMSLRPYRNVLRKKTRQISLKNMPVGGDAPISVQTMTNTLTSDSYQTSKQIDKITEAGADLVRVSCPDKDSTFSLKEVVKNSSIPVIADIHFHHIRAIEAAKAGVACIRINPGNIGKEDRVKDVINAAKDFNCAIRIGVNAGSLEKNILEKYGEPNPEAMVESAMYHAKILQDNDFHEFKISVKASDIFLTVSAYNLLSDKIDCPLHIGITEAGSLRAGTVKSAIGMGKLLWSGIGDTIRVSLSADPVEEVRVGFEMLKSLGIRKKGVTVISCPSCARQQFDVIETVRKVEERLEYINTPLTVSIIGCVVNGPGEAKETDIGITGGGRGTHQIYISGVTDHIIKNEDIVDHIVNQVEKKLAMKN